MAIFQETKRHEDTIRKQPITADDIQFLRRLQTELNTQDNMGNADPVFWVIKGSKFIVSHDGQGTACLYLCEDGTEYHQLDELFNDLRTYGPLSHIISSQGYLYRNLQLRTAYEEERATADKTPVNLCLHMELTGNDGIDVAQYDLYTMSDVLSMLSDLNIHDDKVQLVYEEEIPYIYPDTFFLAHADAQDHLRRYGYNYDKHAHAYAMTATRSERFNQLLHILRITDWATFAQTPTEKFQMILQKELEEIENMTPVPGENETSFRLRQSHWKSAIRALQYRLHDMT